MVQTSACDCCTSVRTDPWTPPVAGILHPAQQPRFAASSRNLPLDTTASRQSSLDGDNVCLNLAVHSLPPEPPGDRLRRNVGGLSEPRGVTRLDLVSERCPLTVRDGWDPGRFCPTAGR